jgi:hypothetical protein
MPKQRPNVVISKKSRDISKYLTSLGANQPFYLGIYAADADPGVLETLGLSTPPVLGELILPAAGFGTASKRNANGYEIVHRDQPMDTAVSWTVRLSREIQNSGRALPAIPTYAGSTICSKPRGCSKRGGRGGNRSRPLCQH